MGLISQSAFARLAGVSRNSISKAIRAGNIKLSESKKIDDRDPLSIQYLRIQLERGEKKIHKTTVELIKAKELPDRVEKQPDLTANTSDKPSNVVEQKQSIIPPSAGEAEHLYQNLLDKDSLDAELKKVQTEKIKIHNAEALKLLVPMNIMKKKFGKISGVILNYFFPMGDRLAPLVCGICGVTDSEIVKQVKNKIDAEVTRSLAEFKKEASTEMKE